VKLIDNSKFSFEERFICFDSFTEQMGDGITLRILEILENFEQYFNLYIGQEYENGANMSDSVKADKPFCLDLNLTAFL
jgi:hypothetical protein